MADSVGGRVSSRRRLGGLRADVDADTRLVGQRPAFCFIKRFAVEHTALQEVVAHKLMRSHNCVRRGQVFVKRIALCLVLRPSGFRNDVQARNGEVRLGFRPWLFSGRTYVSNSCLYVQRTPTHSNCLGSMPVGAVL